MLISSIRLFTILVLLFCFLACPALAEQTDVTEQSIQISTMKQIGEMTTVGVIATAHIAALDPAKNAGQTHRVVVSFVNEKSKLPLAKGLVGIKHRKLFGDVSEPVWMRSVDNQPELFIADVSLNRRGTYLFIVGSKLEDDKKRQFTFQFQF